MAMLLCCGSALSAPTAITVNPRKTAQTIQGMGCGAIFYEGHITSLAERGKTTEQEALYDAMFRDVRTDFLHLMIRHDHEPENDNTDPFMPAFKDEWFRSCEKTIAICEAAKKRLPKIQLYATLYTPPAWMKTNGDPSGGGKARGTLKPGMELELAEFCWAFLNHLHKRGQTVQYLSICNEPDWEHTQPGYYLDPKSHAELFAKVADYFDEMHRRHPDMPKPLLVAPNVLSAVGCAKDYLPPLLRKAPKQLAVVGSHDYDRRGHRWRDLVAAAKGRPVWCTEWCVNGPDKSIGLINSATEFWLAMTEAFNDGANAWMAYDWAYPPRQGGEALIHIDWGNKWTPTKIYHGYRQWCLPLEPGMKVVECTLRGPASTDIGKPGLKASAFVSADGKKLVVHAAAVQDQPADIEVRVTGGFEKLAAKHWRTSPAEDMAPQPDTVPGSAIKTSLPARTMATWVFQQ